MTYTSETELLISQIDLHQLEEGLESKEQTQIAEHITSEFKLEIDDGSNYRSYILSGDYYDIGRDADCSISICNQYISSHHAILRRIYKTDLASGFTYQIIDGKKDGHLSTNGVYVNEERVHKHNLKSGDTIKLGPEVKVKFDVISVTTAKESSKPSKFPISSDLTSYSIIDPFIVTDIEGKIVDCNCAAAGKLGYQIEEIIGVQILNILFADPWKESFQYILSKFTRDHDSSILGRWNNVEVLLKNGDYFSAEVSINSVKTNQDPLLTFTFRDITKNNLRKTQILHKIYEDPLTGLGNRRLFIKRLESVFADSKINRKEKFALLYIDLDGFKAINDTLGHNIGDELLIKVALRLKKCLRDDDVIARQGGDEFTILLEGDEIANSVEQIASRLSDFLNQPYIISNQKVVVTASIGVLVSHERYTNIDEMLRDSDFAMYSAKSQGKGKYIIFNSSLGQQVAQSFSLDRELCFALQRDELFLEYQPIIDPKSGNLTSFEALIRWRHPERGRISPAEFIPIAEKNGTIIDIGIWVLRKACQQLKTWQTKFKHLNQVSVSVNLSIKQLEHRNIVNDIFSIVEDIDLEPSCLKIEITESHLMNNVEDANLKLSKLAEMGIEIYIDDFGTGYSSLKYLNDLSVNALKIDKSFIDKLEEGESGLKLAQSIVYLARALGIQAIAEGVETSNQLACLLSMGCDRVQGFFFSKPMSAEHAETYLTAQSNR